MNTIETNLHYKIPLYKELPNNTKGGKKKKGGLDKMTINIIRTTQRNNIDLTAIADNKANVLLSLNAIMLAALVPLIVRNVELVLDRFLYIPLVFLTITCFATIYIAAQVLKPSKLTIFREGFSGSTKPSPFFFGNFYEQTPTDYFNDLEESFSDPVMIKSHLAQDLYYVGKRLGEKMSWVRMAYNLFIMGIALTLLSTSLVFLFV